jgi:hypothetical protein
LSILQLGTKDNFNNQAFASACTMLVINKILPIIFAKVGLTKEAAACAEAKTMIEGRVAMSRAVSSAYAAASSAYAASSASAAAYASAAYAADTAAYAAASSAYATDAAAYAAAYAADTAAYATDAASSADARDKILFMLAKGVEDILISMNVPGVAWLDLLEEPT